MEASETNKGLDITINLDEAAARCAALQSAILSSHFEVLHYELFRHSLYAMVLNLRLEVKGPLILL